MIRALPLSPSGARARAILSAWDRVVSQNPRSSAVLREDGAVLRTVGEIEAEAEVFFEVFRRADRSGVVLLQLWNRPEWFSLLVAAWRAGHAVVVAEPGVEVPVEATFSVGDRAGSVEILEAGGEGVVADGVDLFKLTSGTTGGARLVGFHGSQLLADCTSVCVAMGIHPGDLNYGVIAFAHSYGLSNLVTPLLVRGIPVVAARDILPAAVAAGLEATGATILPGVPAMFRALAGTRVPRHRLRFCVSAGAPLSVDVAARFQERWRTPLHAFYGSSECGGICYDRDPFSERGRVGRAMPGVHLRPLGDGRVAISGPGVGMGYIPASPDDALCGGTFVPGDLLRPDPPRGWILEGRVSDFINVGGRKVNPEEVERVLRGCAGVRDVVVVGLHDPGMRGEMVAGCVVGEVREDHLRAFAYAALPPWQCPRLWRVVPEIPLSSRGKISRREIAATFFQSGLGRG